MTDLSPEAQAVLIAANNELDHAPWDVSYLAKPAIAAALRAVAHWVDWESGDAKFLVLAIAAELGPKSPTS